MNKLIKQLLLLLLPALFFSCQKDRLEEKTSTNGYQLYLVSAWVSMDGGESFKQCRDSLAGLGVMINPIEVRGNRFKGDTHGYFWYTSAANPVLPGIASMSIYDTRKIAKTKSRVWSNSDPEAYIELQLLGKWMPINQTFYVKLVGKNACGQKTVHIFDFIYSTTRPSTFIADPNPLPVMDKTKTIYGLDDPSVEDIE